MRFVFSILTLMVVSLSAMGSPTPDEEKLTGRDLINRIEESSAGNITIDMDDTIANLLIFTPPQTEKKEEGIRIHKGVNYVDGWRIQVFSDGNNPSTLRNRADARKNAIANRFSKYRGQTYSFSKGPNWYAQVGNFLTQESAQKALNELRRAFPQFAGDMRIVRCTITVRR